MVLEDFLMVLSWDPAEGLGERLVRGGRSHQKTKSREDTT